PVLVGRWTAQMVCTETTCPGSAVGDSKTETWDIQYINNKVIAKAQSGEQLVRVYTGIYTGNTLELVENNESTGTQPATKMVVQLRIVNPRSMEGQREIIREGNCKILYSLQLTKQ
ncbi:MAG TPA: hypothetical protein VM368_00715, partial [Flavisolibacter sp.]|nr:hypothetical protein [Flavisolibacter sp.]